MPTTKSAKPASKSPAKSAKPASKPTSAKSVRKTKGIGGAQPQRIQLPQGCTPEDLKPIIENMQQQAQQAQQEAQQKMDAKAKQMQLQAQQEVDKRVKEIIELNRQKALEYMKNKDDVLNKLMGNIKELQTQVQTEIARLEGQ